MRESAIEEAARTRAKRRGWNSVKVGFDGRPDRLFWQRKVYAWVEFKRAGEVPTRLQAVQIARLRADGESVTVAHSADECQTFLDSLAWWLNDAEGL